MRAARELGQRNPFVGSDLLDLAARVLDKGRGTARTEARGRCPTCSCYSDLTVAAHRMRVRRKRCCCADSSVRIRGINSNT